MPDSENQRCDRCGAPLPHHTGQGLCPSCIARVALSEADNAEPESPGDTFLPFPQTRFGDYELLQETARGGMGVVYRARQISLKRIVAVKMLLFGRFADKAAFDRFRAEAETTARLQHPNIVAIHEIGQTEGQPFFSMDYVAGRNLAEIVKDHPLPGRQAARYVREIARAVHYAHGQGVLHRDLKPANILIDQSDEPRVTDFGLARRLAADSEFTVTGQVIGSPNFMPPEQGAGKHAKAGPESDVYGLGAVLYYLLTARPPFVAQTFEATVMQVLDAQPIAPRQLNPSVPRDLETICLKCLEKDPKRRYRSAEALAEDLERWMASKPIQARRVGWVGRGRLWCRRKPALASLGGALALTLFIGSPVALWRIAAARQKEKLATYASNIALANRHIQDGAIDQALELLYACPPEFRHWEWGHLLYRCHQDILTIPAHTNAPQFLWNTALLNLGFDATGRRLVTHGAEGRVNVWQVGDGAPLFAMGDATNRVTTWTLHPQGTALAVGMTNGTIQIIDTTTWQARFRLEGAPQPLQTAGRAEAITSLAYDFTGRKLAAATTRGRLKAWDATSGRELFAVIDEATTIERIWFTAEGAQLVVQRRLAVRRLDAERGEQTFEFTLDPAEYWAVFADPAGRNIVTIDNKDVLALWRDGRQVRDLGNVKTVLPRQRQVVFSPDGRYVCAAGHQGSAGLLDLETGRRLFPIPTRTYQAAFSRDGTRLATFGAERMVRIWDLQEKQEVLVLRGHLSMAEQAAFSPDGRLLAAASRDGVVKIWSSGPGRERYPVGGWAGAYTPDGTRLSVGSPEAEVTIWDAEKGEVQVALRSRWHGALSAAFSPDGKHIVTGGRETVARIWDATSGELVRVLRGHSRSLFSVAWSRDGRRIATGHGGGFVKIWDAATGRNLHTLPGHRGLIFDVGFDATTRRLVTPDMEGPPRIWDVESGALLFSLVEGAAGSASARFIPPNDTEVMALGYDRRLRIWDAGSGRIQSDWPTRTISTGSIGVTPDGLRLAIPMSDYDHMGFEAGMFGIWDRQHGRSLLELKNHTEPPNSGLFTSDGRRLLTTSMDGVARQEESFPWKTKEYDSFAGDSGDSLPQRVRNYARHYWRQRLEAESSRAPEASPPRSSQNSDRALIPVRDPDALPNLVDLSTHFNQMLNTDVSLVINHRCNDDLEHLPSGLVTFDGVKFDVRGVVMLGRREPVQAWLDQFPTSIQIKLGRRVQRLQILHGVWSWDFVREGLAVASFVWHYADGIQRETEIVYGRDVRHWAHGGDHPDPRVECERGRVVWQGTNPVAEAEGTTRRLYLTRFDNPRPEIEVTAIDYVSKRTQAAPFMVAMTLEP